MAAVPEAEIALAALKPVSPTARPALRAIATLSNGPFVLFWVTSWAITGERAKTAVTETIDIKAIWNMNNNITVLFFKLFPPFEC